MEFTSQTCTTKEQSERLLALGLKRDTADMHHYKWSEGYWDIQSCPPRGTESCYIPAWSLHRLIEMIPNRIKCKNDYYHFNIFSEITGYNVDYVDPDDNYYNLLGHRHNNLFEGIISIVEWLIKEGYFNKEYLE